MRRLVLAVAALLAVARIAPALPAASAAEARHSVWADVWQSESAPERASISGRADTRILIGGEERQALASAWAAGGKMRFDYQVGSRRWSLIDDGRRLIHLIPGKSEAVSFPRPTLATDRALAERNYLARETGEARIAGRRARIIEIVPRRGGPVTHRLWLDRSTAFALKRERYNVEGKLTAGTEYLEIDLDADVPAGTFVVPSGWKVTDLDGGGKPLSLPELTRLAGFTVTQPRYLPAGYVLLGGSLQSRGRWGLPAAELRYTDGIRILSVSQRLRNEEGPGLGGGRGGGHGGGGRHRRGRGEPGGGGRGRGGGGGRGGGMGFGPPDGSAMTLVDRGSEKALRYFGERRTAVVVGDLTADELLKVASSLD